ncbi:hypothetical protein [Pedobacter insulae]|uniref:Uncharacterized protein n=1 Tax=Pedobacter insulae TaxID=414048 RepID=A0A1I3A8H5_9SPHI|nr:hypothetical protein [Pedobacter insulae]SFH46407.1 hypothetical protein SAMN04489864_11384 [Pedobacter insulae]
MMNADVLGTTRIVESKQRTIEMIEKEKDWSNTGFALNDIKFQTAASLVMLMNKFVTSSDLDELNSQG